MRRILLLDDEQNVLNALVRAIRQHVKIDELRLETFTDPQAALLRCGEVTFDIALSDFRMPQMTGVAFLHALMLGAPSTVRMILSASTDFASVSSAISEAQVFRYIAKPWNIDELKESIALALAFRDQAQEELHLADRQRLQEGQLSAQELEAKLLEEDEPGLLKVKWGPNGEVLL
ncbi:MAG: response regulator [Pseudomonadota bacterium]